MVSRVEHLSDDIGIEIDEGYFDIACRRISEQLARPDMFISQKPAKAKQEAFI